MHGFTLLPVLESVMATGLSRTRGFMGRDHRGLIRCPYTGKDIVVVLLLTPNVCAVHVQRANKCARVQARRIRDKKAFSKGEIVTARSDGYCE